MLLQCNLDQSGACTFDAAGWKDSDRHQFIRGNDFWLRDGDMTNPMQQTDIQPLAPLLGMSTTHLTTTSSMPKKKIAIRWIARGPIGKCLEQYSPRHTGTSSNCCLSCNVMVYSLTTNALTCCLDAFWISLVHAHLMLRVGRTPTDSNSCRATTSATRRRHDKSMQEMTIQPLAPMLGMSATHLTTLSLIHISEPTRPY